jgi:hypothetical protein
VSSDCPDEAEEVLTGYREIIFNAISLAAGFFGNFALLLNFTRRIRYIVALPVTIIMWYIATGIVGLAIYVQRDIWLMLYS